MSGIEAIAAMFGIANIVLVARRSLWNYPFALAMVTLYFFVFIDARLYSDALLQIFFFGINLYGWWNWARSDRVADGGVAVGSLRPRARIVWVMGTALAAAAWGMAMARFTDAAAPFADATIAAMSVSAQILQSQRRQESWLLWIAVDLLATGLFFSRGLVVTSALYALFLGIAIWGYAGWRRATRMAAA